MWAVIVLLIVLILSVVALLIAYFDLRDTVKIMRSTIDFQNERYDRCLKGWDESLQQVMTVIKINDDVIEVNRELLDKLRSSEESIKNFDNRINSVEKDLYTRLDSMSETPLKLMGPSEDKRDRKEE